MILFILVIIIYIYFINRKGMKVLLIHFDSVKSKNIVKILKSLNCNVIEYNPYIHNINARKIRVFMECNSLIISGNNPKLMTVEVPKMDSVPFGKSFYSRVKRIIDLFQHKKILGICYGSQILYKYYGGKTMYHLNEYGHKRGEHYKTIYFKKDAIFKNIKKTNSFNFFRNILLDPNDKPSNIKIISYDITEINKIKYNNISGFKINNNVYGLIFHPEASNDGYNIFKNFLFI